MRFSIVIVCHGEDLSGLLDQVERQRRDGDEVIVVDNLATAGGTPSARAHPQVDRLVEVERNLGFPPAANVGVREASRETVLLLNPDAVPAPGCLDAMREPPDGWAAWMGVVALPGFERVNTAGGIAHFLGFGWIGRYGEPVAALPSAPYEVGFLSGACLAVRREVWNRLGGFPDHFFLYFDDVDLSHRLRLAGLPFGALPGARVAHDYEFDKGARKWRNLERNRWATVMRTYPAPLLAAVLPALVALEPFLIAYAAAGGWLRAKLEAYGDLLRWLPRLPPERRAIQAHAAVGPRAFAAGLSASLETPLLGRVGRSRVANAVMRAYWRTALALLRS